MIRRLAEHTLPSRSFGGARLRLCIAFASAIPSAILDGEAKHVHDN